MYCLRRLHQSKPPSQSPPLPAKDPLGQRRDIDSVHHARRFGKGALSSPSVSSSWGTALLSGRRLAFLTFWLALTLGAGALPSTVGTDRLHTVGPEETVFTIARKFRLAPDHILWANDLSLERPPVPGDEIVIPLRRIPPYTPNESTAVVINLPERMLYLYRGGRLAEYWGVAIGGDNYPTPTGRFPIIKKEKDPVWEPPLWLQRKAVPPGPDNPLGDRWMQLTPDMVGLHGTNNPDSIGGVASLGCIRLYPEAARSVYDQVAEGTPVYLVYEQARVGLDPTGQAVWTFFPDPYYKGFTTFQAQEGLRLARLAGLELSASDFEIKERARAGRGKVEPVFGEPLAVKPAPLGFGAAAYRKPTGIWLHPDLLRRAGVTIRASGSDGSVVLEKEGEALVRVSPVDIPLNPNRLPKNPPPGPLNLEGHRALGRIWMPFPLVLQALEIPYRFDDENSTIEFESSEPPVAESPALESP